MGISMRLVQFAFAMTLSWSAAATADAPPELFASLPASVSYFPYADFVVGNAINGGGAVVPAAYMIVYSGTESSYSLWTTDGTAGGTHAAATAIDPADVSASPALGAFFIGYTDATGWQVFRTDGPESTSRALTSEANGVSYMVGLLDDAPLIQRIDDVAGTTTFSKVDPDSGALMDVAVMMGRCVNALTNAVTVFSFREPCAQSDTIELSSFTGDTAPVVLPIPPPSTEWDDPHQLNVGTRLMCFENFTEYSPQDYRQELYCTDGTTEGTRRPVPPPFSRGIGLLDNVTFWPVGDRLLFQGRADGDFALSLWSTDGTDAGTVRLDDGTATLMGEPCTDDRSGGLYYIAGNGTEPASLMFTDGTPSGTRAVTTLPANAYCLGRGTAMHRGGTNWLQIGNALYRTDGTAAGTTTVEGAPSIAGTPHPYDVRSIVAIGRWIVFATPNADGTLGLWRTDTDPIFADGYDSAH